MPLAPAARTMIDQLEAGGGPALWEMSVDDARSLSEVRGAMDEPLEVAKVEDRVIPGPAGDLLVRIYSPDAPAPRPVIAFFHGGGFVICSVETHDGLARRLANAAGAVVVSVEYRLAPEARCPAAAQDCYAATQWIHEHAAELGADQDRLVVAGDSAGGNLAAVVALMARERSGPPIRHQVLVYPVIDAACDAPSYTENAEGYFLEATGMRWFGYHNLGAPSLEATGASADPQRRFTRARPWSAAGRNPVPLGADSGAHPRRRASDAGTRACPPVVRAGRGLHRSASRSAAPGRAALRRRHRPQATTRSRRVRSR